MARASILVSIALACFGAWTACALDDGGRAEPSFDAGPDLTDHELPPADSAPQDSGALDAAADVDAADATPYCPVGLPGPELVWMPGTTFCIDATEVTNAQYDQYRQAYDGGWGTGACSWVDKSAPSGTTVGLGDDDKPVARVHWCDAALYCKWAGKHLCGAIGGGTIPQNAVADAAASQWLSACSDGGQSAYPYGSKYVKPNCNTDSQTGQAQVVGSFKQCVGAPSGVFDMSGNVAEWVDSCNGSANSYDQCTVMSGDYYSNDQDSRCIRTQTRNRNDIYDDTIGFRCCFGN